MTLVTDEVSTRDLRDHNPTEFARRILEGGENVGARNAERALGADRSGSAVRFAGPSMSHHRHGPKRRMVTMAL